MSVIDVLQKAPNAYSALLCLKDVQAQIQERSVVSPWRPKRLEFLTLVRLKLHSRF